MTLPRVILVTTLALLFSRGPAAQQMPEPRRFAGQSSSHIVSPVAMATWAARVDPLGARTLALAVIWRGSPGWFLHQPAGQLGASGGDDRVFHATLSQAGLSFSVELNYLTREAKVQGVTIALGDDNVVLVDDVDAPGGGKIAGRLHIDPALPPGTDPRAIMPVLGRAPDVFAFLRCDVPLPQAQGIVDRLCTQLQGK